MKKKIFAISLLFALMVWVGFEATKKEEDCWLRTEEDGIEHELSYLHELADSKPYKAREYLGKPISFVAPCEYVEESMKLGCYDGKKLVLILSAGEGRCFLVESPSGESDYQSGGLLRVSGRITSITPQRIMLLDVLGTPGYPNDICIERIN